MPVWRKIRLHVRLCYFIRCLLCRPKSLSFEMVHIIIKSGKAAKVLPYPHYQQYLLQWREVARNAIHQLEWEYFSLASR